MKNPGLPGVQDPQERASIYSSMIDTLARIHSVDIDKHNLNDYGARMSVPGTVPYVLRQVKTWSKQYLATETETIADMNYLMAELPKFLPKTAENSTCLVHGDFRLDNLIFSNDSSDVAAVLDWELSTLGDRLSDLAYNCMVYHIHHTNAIMQGLKGG